MGYGSGVKGYRLYDPESHKIIHSRNVTFNENAMLSSVKDTVISSIDTGGQEEAREKVEFEIKTPAHEEDVPNSSSTQDDQVITIDGTSEHLSPHEQCPPKRRGLPQSWSMAQELPQQRPRNQLKD